MVTEGTEGMKHSGWVILSLVLWLQMPSLALAATAPAQVVEQFIAGTLQGHFAEARSLTLERANLSGSLFSSWLFNPSTPDLGMSAADIFLSRKFADAFRHTITSTTPSGDSQAQVTAIRTSPNVTHLYSWVVAPKRDLTPYELIEAVDAYLTKVNYPIEESRMQFTLIREVDEWYIQAITDEKFIQMQQQYALQDPLSHSFPLANISPSSAAAPSAALVLTSTSTDVGRQEADAQFYATLQSFNSTHQTTQGRVAAPPIKGQKPSFLSRLTGLFKRDNTPSQDVKPQIGAVLASIREAFQQYAAQHNGLFPDEAQIRDWQSLRRLVNQYGKKNKQLPLTEAEVGFAFINYTVDPTGLDEYAVLVRLNQPQDQFRRASITPFGVDYIN